MKTLLVTMLLLSTSVFAQRMAQIEPLELKDLRQLSVNAPLNCPVRIQPRQQMQIQRVLQNVDWQIQSLRRQLRMAKRQLGQLLLLPQVHRQEVAQAMRQVKQAERPILQQKRQASLDIQFNVLLPRQRIRLTKCKNNIPLGPNDLGPMPPRRGHL